MTAAIVTAREVVELTRMYCALRYQLECLCHVSTPMQSITRICVHIRGMNDVWSEMEAHPEKLDVEEWMTRLPSLPMSGEASEPVPSEFSDVRAFLLYDPDFVTAVVRETIASLTRRFAHVCNALNWRGVTSSAELNAEYDQYLRTVPPVGAR